MKRQYILYSLILTLILLTNLSFGQAYTTVTATLTDSSFQVWSNAEITVRLIPKPYSYGTLLNQGHTITDSPQTIFANGSGAFSVTIDDLSQVTPAGAFWHFTMCPNASTSNCSVIDLGASVINGVSVNLTSTLSNVLTVPIVNASPTLSRAYTDSEINGGFGAVYWNTISNVVKGCVTSVNYICTAWAPISGGGGGGAPGVTYNIPFNIGGLFQADPSFNYNNTTFVLTAPNISATTSLNSSGNISSFGTIAGYNLEAIPLTPIFTNTQMNEYLYSKINGINFQTEFQYTSGSNFATEGITGGISIPSTSTVYYGSGGAFYINNSSTTTNGTSIFTSSNCLLNNTKCFGFDINVFDSSGLTTGVSLIGGTIQLFPKNGGSAYSNLTGLNLIMSPTLSSDNVGIALNCQGSSNNSEWTTCLKSSNGGAVVALDIGAILPGISSINSQQIKINSINSSGTLITNIIQQDAFGNIFISPQGGGATGTLVIDGLQFNNTGTPTLSSTQGTTGKVLFASGIYTPGDCLKIDSNGNAQDYGSTCGVPTIPGINGSILFNNGGVLGGVSAITWDNVYNNLIFNIGGIILNSSQRITGVQGTTGNTLFAAAGSFISGDALGIDAHGNAIDLGSPSGINPIGRCFANIQAGLDICSKINACYLSINTTSTRAGIIDATGFPIGSTQACNSNPFAGANKSGQLLLGPYTIATSATWITPQRKFSIIGTGQSSPLGSAGNTNSAENTIIEPCIANGNPVGCTAALQQTNNLLFLDTSGGTTCPGTIGTCRQHGPFSASSSGLTGAGNYYALIALGGNNYPSTGCGSGPVGADWTMSSFGGQLINIAFDMQGLNGIIGIYSGNEQERSLIRDISVMNYGGAAAGLEGAGLMWDRNSYNLSDTCASASGNGGPSHYIIEHYFADASPAVVNAGKGYSGILAGYNSTGSASTQGLAQFTIEDGTLRGLSAAKSNYGFWIDHYIDGSILGIHCENFVNDCIYLQNSSNWLISNVDQSAVNNVVELGTGTANNTIINVNGGSGSVSAVQDDVNGCPGAFGAAPPCSLQGTTGYNPANMYVQGGLPIPNYVQFANTAPGANSAPAISGGTGVPTSGCGTSTWPIGSIWLRSDGASGTVSSFYSCKMVAGVATWVGN